VLPSGSSIASARRTGSQPRTNHVHEQRTPPATRSDVPEAESVHVAMLATGLQIVVRHAGLAPEAAVWCAMEAARQLTGDRRSLSQVTLNGHTVYDASQVSQTTEVSTAPIVWFNC
jgi:hypothetical protein